MVHFQIFADGLGVLGLSLPHALFVSVASDFLDIDRTAAKRDPRALIAGPHEQARSSLLDGEIQYRVGRKPLDLQVFDPPEIKLDRYRIPQEMVLSDRVGKE